MDIENLVKEKIIYLFILMIIGYLAAKLKVINEDIAKSISKLILNITFPLLIFTTFITKDLSFAILVNCLYVLLFAYISLFFMFSIGSLSSKLLKLPKASKTIHTLHTTHGNIAFLGFPIIGSIYGSEGLLYASIFILANDSILWTLSVFMINNHSRKNTKTELTHLFNPNTVALLVGLIAMLFQFKLNIILLTPFVDLGHITIVLSMLYIGAMLSYLNIGNIFKHIHVWVLSLNKLLIIPFLLILIFYFILEFFSLQINSMALSVVIIEASMPAMTTIAILAKEYNSDYVQATENIFLTTIISIFSIPFIVFLIHYFLN